MLNGFYAKCPYDTWRDGGCDDKVPRVPCGCVHHRAVRPIHQDPFVPSPSRDAAPAAIVSRGRPAAFVHRLDALSLSVAVAPLLYSSFLSPPSFSDTW